MKPTKTKEVIVKNKNSNQQATQEEVKTKNKVRVYKNSGKYGDYYTAKKGEIRINFSLKQIQIADEYFEKNKNKGQG
jgi:hypothetical protein